MLVVVDPVICRMGLWLAIMAMQHSPDVGQPQPNVGSLDIERAFSCLLSGYCTGTMINDGVLVRTKKNDDNKQSIRMLVGIVKTVVLKWQIHPNHRLCSQ